MYGSMIISLFALSNAVRAMPAPVAESLAISPLEAKIQDPSLLWRRGEYEAAVRADGMHGLIVKGRSSEAVTTEANAESRADGMHELIVKRRNSEAATTAADPMARADGMHELIV